MPWPYVSERTTGGQVLLPLTSDQKRKSKTQKVFLVERRQSCHSESDTLRLTMDAHTSQLSHTYTVR